MKQAKKSTKNMKIFFLLFLVVVVILVIAAFLGQNELHGTWEWEDDSNFIYTFNTNGTGIRGFMDPMGTSMEAFDWEIIDESLHMEFDDESMFDLESESWDFTIEDDTLTLSKGNATYIYNRQ